MKRGFTLIELSIVLVIIGLIIGSIITGRDLVRVASLRATISQVEKYNSVVNTFRGKYGALPGDMLPAKASEFGFYAVTNAVFVGMAGWGNGNGTIDGVEPAIFWRHLSDAKMVDGNFAPDPLLSDTGIMAPPSASISMTNSPHARNTGAKSLSRSTRSRAFLRLFSRIIFTSRPISANGPGAIR